MTGLTGARFADAYPRRITAMLGELGVPIIDRESLIANKRALGRPQDLVDAEDLER